MPKLSDDAVIHAIDERPGLMPSFEDKLTAAEKARTDGVAALEVRRLGYLFEGARHVFHEE